MNEMELLEVIQMKTITDSNGKKHLFSVPITQDCTTQQATDLKGEKKIALKCSKTQTLVAVIEEPVFYSNRKEEICSRIFGTQSTKHCKVERIMA